MDEPMNGWMPVFKAKRTTLYVHLCRLTCSGKAGEGRDSAEKPVYAAEVRYLRLAKQVWYQGATQRAGAS
ncbi:hypothetical protein DPMN_061048 [Dreissena polymorpha]|uniref:Uncharacterized protein n=1 Tax=Dreissena polymorpha TaxID=45954 RepID=A0A9D4HGR2_DREPO|nr:hypothetical protein DPMN_061048 [Dreissena polymorpha]